MGKNHKCELRFIGKLDKNNPTWLFYNCARDKCDKITVLRNPKKGEK